jgi:NAD(P)-dependent dehydrogenase (short-subunit alcohol dehydrogenase family)
MTVNDGRNDARQVVLILGATSPIALAIAREYGRRGARVALGARDLEETDRRAADLRVRFGVDARAFRFDARGFSEHPALVRQVVGDLGPIDVAVVAFGDLGDRQRSIDDFEAARVVLETNYVGAASICEAIARELAGQRHGTIVGIGSVAGERGRYSNYFYGSAKGGFALYLQGLRARMHHEGVHVLTVKPGFIDTPMTWGLRGRIPIASPSALAGAVAQAVEERRDVIYYPWFWRWAMAIVRSVPESRWKKLKK